MGHAVVDAIDPHTRHESNEEDTDPREGPLSTLNAQIYAISTIMWTKELQTELDLRLKSDLRALTWVMCKEELENIRQWTIDSFSKRIAN